MSTINRNANTDLEKTVSNISISIIIRILRYPILLIYVIIIPRLLGPDNYGRLAVMLSLLALLSEFFSSGFALIYAKYLPQFLLEKDQAKIDRLFSGTLLIYSVSSFIIIIVLVCLKFTNFFENTSFLIFTLFYFALIAENFDQILYAYLYGLNFVGKFNLRDLLRTLFRSIYFITLYPILGFSGLILGLILSSFSSSVFAIKSLKNAIKIRIVKPNKIELKNQISFGLYVFLPTILLFFQQQIGPTILAVFSIPSAEIGYYDLANQVYFLIYGIFISSFYALLPISSKFEAQGLSEKNRDWKLTLFRMILPLYFIVYNIFIYFGEEVITLVLGEIYKPVYSISRLHILSITFWIIGQIGYLESITSNKIKSYVLSMVISTTVYLLTALILVSKYGVYSIPAANFASALTFVILISNLVLEDKKNLTVLSIRIIIPSVILIAPVFFLSFENLILKVSLFLISSIIYLGLLLHMKVIIPSELRKVKSVFIDQFNRKKS